MTCIDCGKAPQHGTAMIGQYVERPSGRGVQRYEFDVCGQCLKRRHATKGERA